MPALGAGRYQPPPPPLERILSISQARARFEGPADSAERSCGSSFIPCRTVTSAGAFYPVAPANGNQDRDIQREHLLTAQLREEVTVEPELGAWFPLWGIPI